MIIVAITDPHDPQATTLLRQSHALMQELFPPEENYYLSIDDLRADDIHFYTARIDERIVGTGALRVCDGYGEIKSMFVDTAARGKGVADAILRQIEDQARLLDLPILKLETGNILHAAQKMYARHGFTPCGPFGNYPAVKSSVFMEKTL
ncbi:MAG: GNAT family N-acetyltransferase [Loktanella sp.]|nr:GNAT family N-acetyltransferase [Loktanella sp.]